MITTWIIIKDDIILGSVETDNQQSVIKSLPALGISEYDEIRDTKQNNSVRPKLNINEYNSDYTLKSEVERVVLGYMEAPKGKKLNDKKTELIDKTIKEKIEDGEIELTDYQMYDEETEEIRFKTLDELLDDEIITSQKWYDTKLEQCINSRKSAYINESDGLFFDYQRGEIEKSVWENKVAEIKEKYPKPVMPS